MLKTVSSITNAIGALNFKGTWNASTNTPTIVSGVGVKGDYFVVSVAGSTTIDGISNWGVGDWITYNGTVWQRVEGGADLNGVNLSVSGTTTLSNLTASTALALNASKEIVSVTNTGTGDNVLATSPTLVGDVTLSTGNLVVADTKGIDFSATPGTGTSELFNDYEEGTYTPAFVNGTFTYGFQSGFYTKVGRLVTASGLITWSATSGAGDLKISLPFAINSSNFYRGGASFGNCTGLILSAGYAIIGSLDQSSTSIDFYFNVSASAAQQMNLTNINSSGAIQFTATYMV